MTNSNDLNLLNLMLQDMQEAPAIYRPSLFWIGASELIIRDLERFGVLNFRQHQSALQMYVQNFSGINSRFCRMLHKISPIIPKRFKGIIQILQGYQDGSTKAWQDYRVFQAAETDKPPHLLNLSESSVGAPVQQYSFDGKQYSASFLSYLRGLTFLKKLAPTEEIESVIEIGGGYGTLGEILLKCEDKEYFYVDVDIPPLAFVATHYLQEVFGERSVATYEQTRHMEVINLSELKKQYRAVVLCSWQLPRVIGSADLFVNFISFQEMEPDIVSNYAQHIQRLTKKFVLLRNSRHGKGIAKQPGEIGVITPIGSDYYITCFDEFKMIGTDSAVFGDICLANNFYSECSVMVRQ